MPDYDFDIPELNRIGELMRDVGGDATPKPNQLPKAAKKSVSAPARFRLGSTTIGAFGEGVNWKNDITHQSPFSSPRGTGGPRLGALSVAAFASGANWSNSIGAPPLLTAPFDATPVTPLPNLDAFMSEFAWD